MKIAADEVFLKKKHVISVGVVVTETVFFSSNVHKELRKAAILTYNLMSDA